MKHGTNINGVNMACDGRWPGRSLIAVLLLQRLASSVASHFANSADGWSSMSPNCGKFSCATELSEQISAIFCLLHTANLGCLCTHTHTHTKKRWTRTSQTWWWRSSREKKGEDDKVISIKNLLADLLTKVSGRHKQWGTTVKQLIGGGGPVYFSSTWKFNICTYVQRQLLWWNWIFFVDFV